jgi:outer membrane lipoprotein-sorting protein
MKKFLSVLAGLLVVAALNAQSLDEIVKKFTAANKYDKISQLSTIRISGKMSMMGMDIPMELWMKNPDKIRTVVNFNGQEMITAFDGKKGYTINPMAGSTSPVEMSSDEIKNAQGNNMFRNTLAEYHKDGKLTMLGEENVNSKPAFKIKADVGNGNTAIMFIDKSTYLLSKTTSTVSTQGQMVTADAYPSDYKEVNGLMVPMKTTTSAQGMDMVLTFTKVEVNTPMEDSIFTLK